MYLGVITMKRLGMLVLLTLAMGCQKDEDHASNPSNVLSPNCNAAVAHYSGAIATSCLKTGIDQFGVSHCVRIGQDVAINADVLSNPYENVQVALCTEDGCSSTLYNSHIAVGHNNVRFVDVDQPFQMTPGGPVRHYLTYNITTTTCS